MPDKIPRNPVIRSFVSKPDSLRDLTIFIKSLISSFKTVNVLVLQPSIFLWIFALSCNGISTFSLMLKLFLVMIQEI